MIQKSYFRLHKLIIFSLVFACSVTAQTSLNKFNRVRNIDIQNYVIRTNFGREKKTVFGDTIVSLKPLKDNLKSFELDAVNLDFESVKLENSGADLIYKTADNKIFVTLDKLYSSTDVIAVRFKYSAQPKKGVYFVDEQREDGKIVRASQIWTQGEPEEARHWFPSYDFPDDKATSEQFITVEKGETAIANGELIETIANPNQTKTFHYRMPAPHSTYLTSFVIGTYAKIPDSYKNIPLGYYVYTDKTSIVPKAFGRTKDMMRVFEELTKVDFPFNKYDQTIVANFTFGGMENVTATTMADTEIFLADFEFGRRAVEDLVAHELAHSWFGNLLTCKNWAELWLNEGFATYMEAAYREKIYGRKSYISKIRSNAEQFMIDDLINKKRHGLFNASAGNVDMLFDNPSTTYQKGGAVIHTLRETVGTDNFWKAINIYLTRHRFQNVETGDLKRVMEEVSGVNLDWFFAQWVYGTGHPKLNIKQIYNPQTKILELTVSQVQSSGNSTPAAFVLPMEIEIITALETKTEKIEIKKRIERFSIKLDGKPSKIVFDKDEKIPIKRVKYEALTATK
ncbi:MAG: M1 family metallopeptidase [Acidobacteria bacterium]|nr:M1 family metallopeptidase [Acidobacteriota bacterium]